MNELKLALATPPTTPDPAASSARAGAGGTASRLLAGWRSPGWWFAILIAAGGVFLRVQPWAMWRQMGFDEAYYAHYLDQLLQVGLGGYPDIVDAYKAHQLTLVGSVLPPTRFLYIFCAYLWHGVFGGDPLQNFYAVSRLFGVLTLGLSGLFARRLLPDGRLALGAFALMAFSPLQIHMAQHALADGFFEFWALGTLWALWECLRQPTHKGWLTAYALGLALMVTTKENAFFVWIAVVALIALNHWLRFGEVSRPLLVLTVVGPLVGVAVLVNLAGGVRELIEVYRIGVPKNLTLPYARPDRRWSVVSLPPRFADDQPAGAAARSGGGFPTADFAGQWPRRPAAVFRAVFHRGELRADVQRQVRDEPALRDDVGTAVARAGDGAGRLAGDTRAGRVARAGVDGGRLQVCARSTFISITGWRCSIRSTNSRRPICCTR